MQNKRNKEIVARKERTMWMREDGFTFVELITTLVIIGILAAAALARYIDISQVGKASACAANQMALESAQTLYYTENYINGDGKYADETSQLVPYLQSERLPHCPANGEYLILPAGVIRCSIDNHNLE